MREYVDECAVGDGARQTHRGDWAWTQAWACSASWGCVAAFALPEMEGLILEKQDGEVEESEGEWAVQSCSAVVIDQEAAPGP